MKIIFMGTPDFAKISLESIYNAGHEILAVITNPDKPKGRGMKLIPSPVKEFAIEKNLDILQPSIIKNNEEVINKIKQLNPDIICVVAYGKILPKEILNIPRYGCVNVHGSILPKYRGAAPIQWAILNGDKTTGITTIYMDEGMDSGDIILKKEVEIKEDETTGQLWERLSVLGGELLVETIKQIENGNAPRQKQEESFSIAPMLNKEMAKIDWNTSATQIKNLVRGLNPIMGAYSFLDNKKYKFWIVEVIKKQDFISNILLQDFGEAVNGQIILSDEKKGLYIFANGDIVSVLEIQAENSKRMSVKDFLRGNKINGIFENFVEKK